VQRLFSIFPAGAAGFALLLVRVSIAVLLAALVFIGGLDDAIWPRVVVCITAISLCGGAFTPLSCIVAVAIELRFLSGLSPVSALHQCFLVLVTIALGILGPGAFSVDARLFGRRVLPQ
jgi:hypothetical protein